VLRLLVAGSVLSIAVPTHAQPAVQPGDGEWKWVSAREGPFTINFFPDEQAFNQAFGAEAYPDMTESLGRVKARFQSFLMDNAGLVRIDVAFEDVGAVGAIATGFPNGFAGPTLDQFKAALQAIPGEPAWEQTFYQTWPATNYSFRSGADPAIKTGQQLLVATALAQTFGFPAPQRDAKITVNTHKAAEDIFDWDLKDGLGAGQEPFEALAMHEVFHALGLASQADYAATPEKLMVWDLCRFREGAGPVITGNENTTEVRELRPTQEAIYAYRLSGSYTNFASRGAGPGGDGNQASHWRDFRRLDPMEPIGVLDPRPGAFWQAEQRTFGEADLQALDIIGWKHDPNNYPVPAPQPIPKKDPEPQAYLVSTTPTFSWGPSSSDKWHLTVFEGTSPDPKNKVLSALNLATQTYAVSQANALMDATEYSWLVSGEIFAGFDYSELTTFVVCRADCDQGSSAPGTLDVFDFLCFQDAFANSDPYACNFDTSTGMGVCDTFDFLAFQDAFTAGCP